MPGFMRSRPRSVSPESDRDKESIKSGKSSSTPTNSLGRKDSVSGRVAKGVKRQIKKLDNVYHHVTHTEHRHRERTKSTPNLNSASSPQFLRSIRSKIHSSSDSWRKSNPSPNSSPRAHSKLVSEIDLVGAVKAGSTTTASSSFEHLPTTTSTSSTTPPVPPPPPFVLMDEERVSREDVPASFSSEPDQPTMSAGTDRPPQPPDLPSEPLVTDPLDPFLVDEEGDAASEEEESHEGEESAGDSQHDDISLADNNNDSTTTTTIPPTPASAAPDVNKDTPLPPTSEEDEVEDDELPEVYLPAIISPSLFLPIPNTDPLTTLLNKYIYPPEKRPNRDVTGEWQKTDFHTLVMTNSWRALAKMARDRLLIADPGDLTLVLGLWHLRLSCLARLRLFNQTSAECTNLFNVLNGIEPPEAKAYVFERVLPFELEVMQTRVKYWTGDHMGYLDTLAALLRKCQSKCRASGKDPILVPMWKERGARVCLIMASQLIEMKEFTAAAKLLEPLCTQGGVTSPDLQSSVARIYLQGGNTALALKHFEAVNNHPDADANLKRMNKALVAVANGKWEEATEALRALLEEDGKNLVAVNNLAVALLGQGKLKEGILLLENALALSPSTVVVAEPFLFNLSTLYELRSSLGLDKKKDLLVEVAKWSGDGLRASCLKMPMN